MSRTQEKLEFDAVQQVERAADDLKTSNVEFERGQLLAELPDPDHGKSDEEKKAMDKNLMRKVDLWLVPWLSFLYLLSFLDRANIGNARLAGMEKDLAMNGFQYNMSLTIFFISYAIFEPITNALLKRLTPRFFFTAIIVAWGTIMTLMGLVTNYKGLLIARFFLGVAEAGLFPGVTYYLSCWYKSSEIGVRIAVFFSAAAIAGSFGGLLAAAIALMGEYIRVFFNSPYTAKYCRVCKDNNYGYILLFTENKRKRSMIRIMVQANAETDGIGNRPGWAWIFILEGLVTVIAGIASWWMVFDWPETARFLSTTDRVRVQRRLILDRQGKTAEDFDRRYIFEAVKDWKTYVFMVIYMGCLVPLYAFSLFLPTIVQGMGYKGHHAQLLTVPPYVCAAVVTVCIGFFADHTRWRGYCNMATVTIGMIGFALLISSSNIRIQYAGTFLGAAGIYPTIPNTLSWVSNNTEGSLKRAVVLGLVVGWGNLNGVVSSNIYLKSQRPRFWTGHGVVIGYQALFLMGGTVFMHFALKRENAARRAGRRNAMHDSLTEEEKTIKGDRRPDFIYTT